MSFGIEGTVAEVLVEEGQYVESGQALARLDQISIASLERSIIEAPISLRNAEEALDQAIAPPDSLDVAEAEAAVAAAELSVRDAQDALDALTPAPLDDDVVAAQSRVDTAEESLANADRELWLARNSWDSMVEAAVITGDAGLEEYRNSFERWLGADTSTVDGAADPEEQLALWGIDLEVLFPPDASVRDVSPGLDGQRLPMDDPATPWNEFVVYAWNHLYPGAVVTTCEDFDVSAEVRCIMDELETAWTAFSSAADDLDKVNVEAAKALSVAGKAVDVSMDALKDARDDLSYLIDSSDPAVLASKQKDLASAQAKLEAALKKMAEVNDPADPLDIAFLEADIVSATLALDTFPDLLAGAVMKAPMSGVVSSVDAQAGGEVDANSRIIEIVDPTIIEVDGIVDEIDVLFVQVGAQARVTMDALPGQALDGIVSFVALAGNNEQGLVSYPIRIEVQLPEGLQPGEGLSATADIILREENNVLLVPLMAVYGTFDQSMVRVFRNDSIEEQQVELGNSDDFWVAVRDGLTEGDQVVIQASSASADPFAQLREIFEGGGPGGFGPVGPLR